MRDQGNKLSNNQKKKRGGENIFNFLNLMT